MLDVPIALAGQQSMRRVGLALVSTRVAIAHYVCFISIGYSPVNSGAAAPAQNRSLRVRAFKVLNEFIVNTAVHWLLL